MPIMNFSLPAFVFAPLAASRASRPSQLVRERLSSRRSSFVPVPTRCSAPPVTRTSPVRACASGIDCDALEKEWSSSSVAKSPSDIIDVALSNFPGEAAIAFSGAEDVVLIEYASRTGKPFRVFALDTGRLHPETYRFYAEVEKHYGIKIEYTFPDAQEVTDLVNEKGLFSFYVDGHQECCRVRKVRPLRRKLSTLRAWITGQRKDQSPGTRNFVPMIQVDPAFKGVDDSDLVKFNPLANISSSEVWATIRAVEVPYNALHSQGFISIGCEPCTRPVLPNQHEREGRWWWEEATQKECGLHKGNISTDAAAAELADDFVTDSIASDSVVIFSKAGCPHCAALMQLLNEMSVPYKDIVISEMPNYPDIVAALERATNQTTAPNFFIGGKHVGGNDDTQRLFKSGQLRTLLIEAGVDIPITA